MNPAIQGIIDIMLLLSKGGNSLAKSGEREKEKESKRAPQWAEVH
tara:strand:+ start:71 stop:205 length:135 start_codon:yes stop_codon:yes gene_type:complete